MVQRTLQDKEVKYSYGPYNKVKGSEQWIRITEGCPNRCPYCYEPEELKIFPIPEILRNDVKIMDMNLLCKHQSVDIIRELAEKRVDKKVVHYELLCGVDYRYMTQELADLLKQSRFKNIRLAWDHKFSEQLRIKSAIDALKKAGYASRDIMVFMICNHSDNYEENLKKLDLCKVWGVAVADCYFDNQTSPNIIPIRWKKVQIQDFRRRVRKHNQLISFGIDPEVYK